MLAIHFIKAGCHVSYIAPADDKVNEFLNKIRWKEFVGNNLNENPSPTLEYTESSMPIWRISRFSETEYVILLKSWFSSIDSTKDWDGVEELCRELLNNVSDHSESKTGAYIFAQYFPRIGEIEIAIGDMGVGLVEKIRQNDPDCTADITERQIIERAFTINYSTRSVPNNRGLGLDIVKSTSSALNGTLTCFVGSSVAIFTKKKKQIKASSVKIQGTMFVLKFETDNLNTLEYQLHNFDF